MQEQNAELREFIIQLEIEVAELTISAHRCALFSHLNEHRPK